MKTFTLLMVSLYFVPLGTLLATPPPAAAIMAQIADPATSPPMQYGALGLLGLALWYFGSIWKGIHEDNKQTIERIVTEKTAALRDVTNDFKTEISRRDERHDRELERRDNVIKEISTAIRELTEEIRKQKP